MKAPSSTITPTQQICLCVHLCHVPSPDEHATLTRNSIIQSAEQQLHRHSKCAVPTEMSTKMKWKLLNTCFINNTIKYIGECDLLCF